MLIRARQTLQRFKRNTRGVAAVEFALIIPVMLAVYIGSIEASTLITMDRKVQTVASTVGDLVSRAEELEASRMEEFFLAATGIMTPYDASPIRQTVTVVHIDEFGNPIVDKSVQYENATYSPTSSYAVGNSYPLPQEMVDIANTAPGTNTVIIAEVSYAYTPLFGIFFNQPVNLYRSSFFLPRFGGTVKIKD